MRSWSTGASIDADTGYSPIVRRAFRARFVPTWLLNVLTRWA
jgi:hypothetical protein